MIPTPGHRASRRRQREALRPLAQEAVLHLYRSERLRTSALDRIANSRRLNRSVGDTKPTSTTLAPEPPQSIPWRALGKLTTTHARPACDEGLRRCAQPLPPRQGELTSRGNSPRNRSFESISLQQTVRLSPDFASVPGKTRVFRHFGGRAGRQRRQRRAKPSNIAPRRGSVSVGRYSSTAVLRTRFARLAAPAANEVGVAISVGLGIRIGSRKAEQAPLIWPGQWQT
jgi:hypothetical protein